MARRRLLGRPLWQAETVADLRTRLADTQRKLDALLQSTAQSTCARCRVAYPGDARALLRCRLVHAQPRTFGSP